MQIARLVHGGDFGVQLGGKRNLSGRRGLGSWRLHPGDTSRQVGSTFPDKRSDQGGLSIFESGIATRPVYDMNRSVAVPPSIADDCLLGKQDDITSDRCDAGAGQQAMGYDSQVLI